jgi:hypothetical protein
MCIPGDPPRERRYYECKVCDAKLVLLDGNEETA